MKKTALLLLLAVPLSICAFFTFKEILKSYPEESELQVISGVITDVDISTKVYDYITVSTLTFDVDNRGIKIKYLDWLPRYAEVEDACTEGRQVTATIDPHDTSVFLRSLSCDGQTVLSYSQVKGRMQEERNLAIIVCPISTILALLFLILAFKSSDTFEHVGQIGLYEDDKQYRRSGKVNLGRFFFAIVGTLLVCIALGWLLDFILRIGFYLLFAVPFLISCIAAIAHYEFLKWAHCRNISVAVLLGILAAFVHMLSTYYFGMINEKNDTAIYDPHKLVNYIEYRMDNDVIIGSYTSRRSQQKASPIGNGIPFFGELFISLIVFMFASRVARNAYCEKCQKWMTKRVLFFERDEVYDIERHVKKGNMSYILGLLPISFSSKKPITLLMLESCQCSSTGGEVTGYLSLKASSHPKRIDSFYSSYGRKVLYQITLSSEQISLLLPKFAVRDRPSLSSYDPDLGHSAIDPDSYSRIIQDIEIVNDDEFVVDENSVVFTDEDDDWEDDAEVHEKDQELTFVPYTFKVIDNEPESRNK